MARHELKMAASIRAGEQTYEMRLAIDPERPDAEHVIGQWVRIAVLSARDQIDAARGTKPQSPLEQLEAARKLRAEGGGNNG